MTTAERERAIKIATVALHRAMADDLPGAAAYIKRLSGSNGLVVAIVGWIDTYFAKVYPEHKRGDALAIQWLNVPEGQIETADEVSPAMRWAGRLLAMRAMDDEAGFYAVLHSAPEGADLGDGIMALLHLVATGLNDPALVRRAGGLPEQPPVGGAGHPGGGP